MALRWISHPFADLQLEELYALLRLRQEVFVVEQDCAYLDLDGKDQAATHMLCFDGEELIAYQRCLPPGVSYPESAMGRIVVAYDKQGNPVTTGDLEVDGAMTALQSQTPRTAGRLSSPAAPCAPSSPPVPARRAFRKPSTRLRRPFQTHARRASRSSSRRQRPSHRPRGSRGRTRGGGAGSSCG